MSGNERPEGANAQFEQSLSAWLDGELDKDGADSMNSMIATDESLARRAERMKQMDALVRAAVPEEAVPAELLQRLGLGGPAEGATVVDLATARRERSAAAPLPAPRRWSSQALWRIAAQVLVIGGLGVGAALWIAPRDRQTEPDAAYRTLSNAPRAAAAAQPAINAVIVFETGTSPVAAHRIATSAGARLIGGPNGAGAWKASIVPGRRDAVLATLRGNAGVTMAEPVDGAAP